MLKLLRYVAAASLFAVFLSPFAAAQEANAPQGWTIEDRRAWYRASQGSRLAPESWFMALERHDAQTPFAAPDNLARFGLLAGGVEDEHALPVGVARDEQDDNGLTYSRLRWRVGQGPREKWVGLNCAACHTGEIQYKGERIRIDGGQSLFDYQSFIEAFDLALIATRRDMDKFKRFAKAVLGARDSGLNRQMLLAAMDQLIAWQNRSRAMNATPLRSGYGRVDAFGHIFNKTLMFAGADESAGNPADAPVSYPFLWNAHRQFRVQWNGAARNIVTAGRIQIGALGRNTGEVLGVFGDVLIEPETLTGYRSSVNATNLQRLEKMLHRLEPPKWPDIFPPIDAAKAEEGEALFRRECAACHRAVDAPEPTEFLLSLRKTRSEDLTDIWMACNSYSYEGPTAKLEGARMEYLRGPRFEDRAPVHQMLRAMVKGVIVDNLDDVARDAALGFIGVERPPIVAEEPDLEGASAESPALREARRKRCMQDEAVILAYKARPLDGIWATPPYLHNGSVPNLYQLLLPASERAGSFWVGSRDYDAKHMGYRYETPDDALAFEFQTRRADGAPIDGNGNAGHEYGAQRFTEEDRQALLEYLKTL